jgi:hypothetical protein
MWDMVHDGFAGRWCVMNLHIGDGLLSDCFTFVGYLPKFSLGRWRSSDNLVMFYMMATWSLLLAWRTPYIGGGVFCILEEGSGS